MTEPRERLNKLLSRVADGDAEALSALYSSTSAKLFGVCLGILRDRALAEDALQEGFVRIWRNAGRFDPDRARAMTWMISICRNRALTLLDRQQRQRVSDMPDEALEGLLGADERGDTDPADLVALQRCLDQLDGNQRKAITEAYLTGHTHSELAERMARPAGTIKSWIRRGLASLHACLEGGEDADAGGAEAAEGRDA